MNFDIGHEFLQDSRKSISAELVTGIQPIPCCLADIRCLAQIAISTLRVCSTVLRPYPRPFLANEHCVLGQVAARH